MIRALQIPHLVAEMSDMPKSSTPLPTALGRPAIRAFEGAGLRTLGDLEGSSERVLLDLHGVGPRALKILREQGVSLRP